MNNKGFTLIELIVTILLIGLLFLFGIPYLMGIISDNKTSSFNYYGEAMIAASKLYIQKEGRDIKEAGYLINNDDTFFIQLDDPLKKLEYIDTYTPANKSLSLVSVSLKGNIIINGVEVKVIDKDTNTYRYSYQLSFYDSSLDKYYIKTIKDNNFIEYASSSID